MSLEKRVLLRAKELISTPDKWTTGAAARNSYGKKTHLSDPDTQCFCIVGSIRRAQYELDPESQTDPYDESYQVIKKVLLMNLPLGENNTIDFNDSSTHEEVLRVLDKTIEAF